MFREHLTLIQEAVYEGSNRGIESFLETLNQDLKMDEVIEENGGTDSVLRQLYEEHGFSVTELEDISESSGEGDINQKLDTILESLKREGLVD